jgi:hypothetical protein
VAKNNNLEVFEFIKDQILLANFPINYSTAVQKFKAKYDTGNQKLGLRLVKLIFSSQAYIMTSHPH